MTEPRDPTLDVAVVLRLAALAPANRMGVVEPDQPLAIRRVLRERIVDAMRFLRRHWHPRHHEPDPMAALRVHHEDLPVEVEKHRLRSIRPYEYQDAATLLADFWDTVDAVLRDRGVIP